MCGIFAAVNVANAPESVIAGLRRLEYRGYDSAGLAAVTSGGHTLRRACGNVSQLAALLEREPVRCEIALGHTRWATHGEPATRNAHPHIVGRVAVVHNGIIENYQALRRDLISRGATFASDTDTEVIPHLIEFFLQSGETPRAAVAQAISLLEGRYCFVASFKASMSDGAAMTIAARRGSPLCIGSGLLGTIVASDELAMPSHIDELVHVNEDSIAVLHQGSVSMWSFNGEPLPFEWTRFTSHTEESAPDLRTSRTEMEIRQQPRVAARLLEKIAGLDQLPASMNVSDIRRLRVIGCGSSRYSALLAASLLEAHCGLQIQVEIASEARYLRRQHNNRDALHVFVSQSGETADTLACLELVKAAQQPCVVVTNVQTSSMARSADAVIPLLAGAEIGVASTKAFLAQVLQISAVALEIAVRQGFLTRADALALVHRWAALPDLIEDTIALVQDRKDLFNEVARCEQVLFIGRQEGHALALEGALKLKELSYIHAEAFAAGELKHGPIALVTTKTLVVAMCPDDELVGKMKSNIEEVAARGGQVLTITNYRGEIRGATCGVTLPDCDSAMFPFAAAVVLQILACRVSEVRKCNVDRPRNLAKSVTVE